MIIDDILAKSNLFWQYPVLTEKTFYEQNKNDENFLGFPWATVYEFVFNYGRIKDQNHVIIDLLKPYLKSNKKYYTCCQHIYFHKLIPLWKELNINIVYASHKKIGQNSIDGIQIKPCQLYAVNIEDPNKNGIFKDIDFVNRERKYLYSFIGGWQENNYISDIRPRIFKMKHPKNTLIQNTGMWHFNDAVFGRNQNSNYDIYKDSNYDRKTVYYNSVLLASRYSLCPSGSGPNSIRLWESLAVGAIPILLADTLELPHHELWDNAIIRIPETDCETVPIILSKISLKKEKEMRENCLKIYNSMKRNYKT
jgi:hypothetical protein